MIILKVIGFTVAVYLAICILIGAILGLCGGIGIAIVAVLIVYDEAKLLWNRRRYNWLNHPSKK